MLAGVRVDGGLGLAVLRAGGGKYSGRTISPLVDGATWACAVAYTAAAMKAVCAATLTIAPAGEPKRCDLDSIRRWSIFPPKEVITNLSESYTLANSARVRTA